MERKGAIITGTVVVLVAAKMLLNFIAGPARTVRAELAADLAQIPERAPRGGAPEPDYAALSNPILEKQSLWRELIAPAPLPPRSAPKAPPPAAAPDLTRLLKDLVLAPGQIGKNRMRVLTPEHPDGKWMAIGESYNGCTLMSFTREEATFSHDWKAGGKKLTTTLPRPLR